MSSNSTFSEVEDKADAQVRKDVRCKNCGYTITSPSFEIQPHEHTFRNPAGYSFHVLCYSAAPGAAEAGAPTTEASWFEGHAWSFAICVQCHNHLGWWYVGPTSFAGLIATRLIRT